MNNKRFTRGEGSGPGTQQASPPESAHVLYLKLLSRYTAGVLTLGRFLTNPFERPDYVLRHHCRPQMPAEGQLEAVSCSVTEIQ